MPYICNFLAGLVVTSGTTVRYGSSSDDTCTRLSWSIGHSKRTPRTNGQDFPNKLALHLECPTRVNLTVNDKPDHQIITDPWEANNRPVTQFEEAWILQLFVHLKPS